MAVDIPATLRYNPHPTQHIPIPTPTSESLMIPAPVMQWLTQYARPSAIMELYEVFSDPIDRTVDDIDAALQLKVLYATTMGNDIDEDIENRARWFREHTK